MRKQVYLHIGAHKTGTTALQQRAVTKRKALARQGLDYPDVAIQQFGHHEIPFSLRGRPVPRAEHARDPDAVLGEVVQAVRSSACEKVFLSSEEMLSLNAAQVARIAAALAPFETRILLTLRRPDTLYLSSYNQRIKHPMNDFVLGLQEGLDTPWTVAQDVTYLRHYNRWAEAFGDGNITVLLHEHSDPVRGPMAAAGVRLRPRFQFGRINASAPAVVCHMMRQAKLDRMEPPRRRVLLQAALARYRKSPHLVLSRQEQSRVLAAVAEETQAMFDRLDRPNPYATDLVPPPRGVAPPVPSEAALRTMIGEIMDKVK